MRRVEETERPQSREQQLLNDIKQKSGTLKKTSNRVPAEKPVEQKNQRENLMEEIKKGKKLKKIDGPQKRAPTPDLQQEIVEGLGAKIKFNKDDRSGETDGDDSDWDD